jgi:hypothetical protein
MLFKHLWKAIIPLYSINLNWTLKTGINFALSAYIMVLEFAYLESLGYFKTL